MSSHIHTSIDSLAAELPAIRKTLQNGLSGPVTGLCGFDGFIDTFIRLESPKSMEEFGPKVAAAAGIATSFPVRHLGDKFGGNGPLFARALHDLNEGHIDLTYIGAVGDKEILPIFHDALSAKMKQVVTLADPAHSDCLEFTDGKIMLGDLSTCSDITWERLLDRMGEDDLDNLLTKVDCISAVNWGKLPHAGEIWLKLAEKLKALGREAKSVPFFMDLAEFEHRPEDDLKQLLDGLPTITEQCHTLLSFNLKEAWQMGAFLGKDLSGNKEPEAVAELAAFLHEHIRTDRIIIHPNSGAACASEQGTVYVPGPYCKEPLISTGAGDNFGAGCLTAVLLGLDDTATVLLGNCTSGYFVRSGNTPDLEGLDRFLELWSGGELPERL
jgi:sugar/nucleoside kinase (ribokinase family)